MIDLFTTNNFTLKSHKDFPTTAVRCLITTDKQFPVLTNAFISCLLVS